MPQKSMNWIFDSALANARYQALSMLNSTYSEWKHKLKWIFSTFRKQLTPQGQDLYLSLPQGIKTHSTWATISWLVSESTTWYHALPQPIAEPCVKVEAGILTYWSLNTTDSLYESSHYRMNIYRIIFFI